MSIGSAWNWFTHLIVILFRLPLLQFQKISVLISSISQKKNVPVEHIALMLKQKPLSESETLNSAQYIQGLVISKLNAVATIQINSEYQYEFIFA